MIILQVGYWTLLCMPVHVLGHVVNSLDLGFELWSGPCTCTWTCSQ